MSQNNQTCDCRCVYFMMEPEKIYEDKIIEGVRQRKVLRRCLFDLSKINSWAKHCPREKGPLIRPEIGEPTNVPKEESDEELSVQ